MASASSPAEMKVLHDSGGARVSLQMKRSDSFESQKSGASFESTHSADVPAPMQGGAAPTYASRFVMHILVLHFPAMYYTRITLFLLATTKLMLLDM